MNDTPRTDMHRLTVAGRYAPAEVVDAEVARTLERELAAAKAQADEGKKAQDELNRITAYVMGYWPASFCFTHPFQAVQHVGNEMAKAQKENAELRAEVERLRTQQDLYRALAESVSPFVLLVSETAGRIPVERLSFSQWHNLSKAYSTACLPTDAAIGKGE